MITIVEVAGDNMGNGMPSNVPMSSKTENENEIKSMTGVLSDFVLYTYNTIRILATIGMMSVLVYIGIRILLSSTSEKAKYKQMLGDWLVGMVLLYTLHYIMYFSNSAVDSVTSFLNNIKPVIYEEGIEDPKGYIKEAIEAKGITDKDITGVGEKDGMNLVIWRTDLMGTIRMKANSENNENFSFLGYTIMFTMMVIYTCSFIFMYIKRFIYMAFLTMIAPLVALTYPIDKVRDGSAQGFNYWFKEYIFNLLLQPVHLIIYTLLVSAAIKFASVNFIYSLCALGFIASAEKIIRTMFGFQKANTPGAFAGPAGAALAFTGMQKLLGRGTKNREKSNSSLTGGKNSSTDENNGKVNIIDKTDSLEDGLKDVAFDAPNEQINGEILTRKDDSAEQENVRELPIDDEKPVQTDLPQLQSAQGENATTTLRTQFENGDEENHSESNIPKENITIPGESINNPFNLRDIPEYKKEGFLSGVKDIASEKKRQIKNNFNEIKTDLNVRKDVSKKRMGDKLDNLKYSAKKKMRDGTYVSNVAKALSGTAVGAAGLIIGTAAGAASGDAYKAFQYGITGAIGGDKFGQGLGNGGKERAEKYYSKQDETRREMLRTRYGVKEGDKRFKEMKQEEEINKIIENPQTIRMISEKLGVSKEEAKKIAKPMITEYSRSGIDDLSEMIKIEKYKNSKNYNVIDKNTKKRRSMNRGEYAQISRLGKAYDMRSGDKQDKINSINKDIMQRMKLKDENNANKLQGYARDFIRFKEK